MNHFHNSWHNQCHIHVEYCTWKQWMTHTCTLCSILNIVNFWVKLYSGQQNNINLNKWTCLNCFEFIIHSFFPITDKIITNNSCIHIFIFSSLTYEELSTTFLSMMVLKHYTYNVWPALNCIKDNVYLWFGWEYDNPRGFVLCFVKFVIMDA